ncbi:hypothetical protein BS580_18095 [Acinetobacter baumannii]|uniref:hypothetical protein n=1 Tax=Acinetobacter baumannii TaxID=470 RepID=UPI00095F932F|nr:hypothetical protein [Acinetobacter baumannii]OLV69660.1 hypothetical protein BS580_18095 [Acinetobacter baumannii]
MIELTPEQLAVLDQSAGPIGWLESVEITPPILNYRAYIIGRYDVPAYVVRDLEVVTVTRDYRGSSFEAQAPGLNDSGNGEIYSASTDESLEGFYA